MSKKFTGVHSGGQNIPVYDKDAHSAIEQKLNTSAFQSVSGNFLTAVPDAYATKEYADGAAIAAASGKLDTDTFSQVSGDFLTAVPQSYLQNTDLTVTSGKVTEISGIPLSAGGTLPDTIPVSGVSGISVTETENEVLIGISADFATPTDLESKLDTSAFSAVSGNFLTAVPDEYVSKEYLSGQISGKYDTSSFAEVSGNFLTAVPESATSGFATHEEVESAVSGKQNTLEFGYDGNSAISGINGSALAGGIDPSMLTGYAEYSAISARLAPEDIAIFTYGKQSAAYPYILSAYAAGKICFAKREFENKYYPLIALTSANDSPYSNPNRATFGKWNAGTTSQSVWSGTVTNATMNLLFVDGASDKSGSDGWSYGWTQNTFIPQKYGDYYSASNPSGFLTAIPEGYMATSGLEYDGDKISGYMGSAFKAGDELPQSVTDAADYVSANSGSIDATIGTVSSSSGAWGGSALPFSARDGLDLEMSGGMLWIGASALNETLSGKQDSLTFEYNENDAISAINGSALAGGGGGGDVPEGVMAESGLEFNAVNEISGYNGSAIAQYGAEKQWLVHDDTLVHAANSAQYALGVNLSAVAQLLGVDETVLYSGNLSQGNKDTIELSEPITNFEKFKVYGAWNYNSDCRMYSQLEIDTVNSGIRFDLNTFGPVYTTAQSTSAECYWTVGCYKFSSPTAIEVVNAIRFHSNLGAFSDSDTIKIYKVIGIGRKQ